jgi:hypothetical protein
MERKRIKGQREGKGKKVRRKLRGLEIEVGAGENGGSYE